MELFKNYALGIKHMEHIFFCKSLLMLNYTGDCEEDKGGEGWLARCEIKRKNAATDSLLGLLGNGGEEGVAAEEGDDAHHHEVLHRLEHVELEPEVQVQREYRA